MKVLKPNLQVVLESGHGTATFQEGWGKGLGIVASQVDFSLKDVDSRIASFQGASENKIYISHMKGQILTKRNKGT